MSVPDELYLPTETGQGTCFHATVCGIHHLEPVPVEEAVVTIRAEGLTPCGACVDGHGLDPTLGGLLAERGTAELLETWRSKAAANVEKWGEQSVETLLLAAQEELGELTQAHLEARAEGGDPARREEELDDLGALLIQLSRALDRDD